MLNTLVLGQVLIGTPVHGWGDARRAARPIVTTGNQTR